MDSVDTISVPNLYNESTISAQDRGGLRGLTQMSPFVHFHESAGAVTFVGVLKDVGSAGRVFNELSATGHAVDRFLQTGSLEGIGSEHDLVLLQDLRDVSQFIIDHGQAGGSIDSGFVRGVNVDAIE